jgi:hypothetical protein
MRLFQLDDRKWINLNQVVSLEYIELNSVFMLHIEMSNGDVFTLPEKDKRSVKFDEAIFANSHGREA